MTPTVSSRLAMGGRLEITLFSDDPSWGQRALEAAYSEVARIEQCFSRFLPASDLSRINRLAASGPVVATPELFALIQQSLTLSALTGGAFDVTAGPGRPGGYRHVRLHPVGGTIEFRAAHLQIDLGAIGKGYAADRAAAVLTQHGITAALIGFGSTTYGLGSPPGQTGWRVAIRHPHDRERAIGMVTLTNRALSTSGGYEQAGHIIDPRSGQAAAGALSASVLATTAAASDALSTAAFVLGPAAIPLLTGVESLVLTKRTDGRLSDVRSPGWPVERPTAHVGRRQFVAGLLALLGWSLLPPLPSFGIVYFTREEAARRLLPEADALQEEEIALTPEQKEAVQQRLGGKIKETHYTVWIGTRQGTPVGYGVVLDVTGKEQPITFMVAVSPVGAILGIDVLVYRESQGSEIRAGYFMRQFTGKTLAASLKLNRDIDSISGATLSSRSTTHAAKKALALVDVVYRTQRTGNGGDQGERE